MNGTETIDLSPLVQKRGYYIAPSMVDGVGITFVNLCRPLNPIEGTLCPPNAAVCHMKDGKPQVRWVLFSKIVIKYLTIKSWHTYVIISQVKNYFYFAFKFLALSRNDANPNSRNHKFITRFRGFIGTFLDRISDCEWVMLPGQVLWWYYSLKMFFSRFLPSYSW